MEFDIQHPLRRLYKPGTPRSTPGAAYDTHKAIEASQRVLAEQSQLFVWLLEEWGPGSDSNISGIYVTLEGAINGAVAITTDEFLLPESGSDPDQHRKYADYIREDVRWEMTKDNMEMGDTIGFVVFSTTVGESVRHWVATWSEVMP